MSRRALLAITPAEEEGRMAQPSQEIQMAGVPGGGGREMLAPLLVVLFVLGLHAVITGRTLSPSVQARGPRTVRVIGGVALAFAVVAYLVDRCSSP
jgi:hypothetical protein